MNQFGFEHLQALLQLRCPVLNFFFDVGSFKNLITDVNIHARLDTGEGPVKPCKGDSTPDTPLGKQNPQEKHGDLPISTLEHLCTVPEGEQLAFSLHILTFDGQGLADSP